MSIPICSICFDETKPGDSKELGSVGVCGHVFHEICLQQWVEYCRPKRSITCPFCKAVCTKKDIHRLFFQFSSDSKSPTKLPRGTASSSENVEELRGEIRRLEGEWASANRMAQASAEKERETLRTLEAKERELRDQIRVNLRRAEGAETSLLAARREAAQAKTASIRAREELRVALEEKAAVLEAKHALEQRMASIKLVHEVDMDAEEVRRMVSSGGAGRNKDDVISQLTSILINRNKSYKDLIVKCNKMGTNESKAQRQAETAVAEVQRLQKRVRELEKLIEKRDVARLRALAARRAAAAASASAGQEDNSNVVKQDSPPGVSPATSTPSPGSSTVSPNNTVPAVTSSVPTERPLHPPSMCRKGKAIAPVDIGAGPSSSGVIPKPKEAIASLARPMGGCQVSTPAVFAGPGPCGMERSEATLQRNDAVAAQGSGSDNGVESLAGGASKSDGRDRGWGSGAVGPSHAEMANEEDEDEALYALAEAMEAGLGDSPQGGANHHCPERQLEANAARSAPTCDQVQSPHAPSDDMEGRDLPASSRWRQVSATRADGHDFADRKAPQHRVPQPGTVSNNDVGTNPSLAAPAIPGKRSRDEEKSSDDGRCAAPPPSCAVPPGRVVEDCEEWRWNAHSTGGEESAWGDNNKENRAPSGSGATVAANEKLGVGWGGGRGGLQVPPRGASSGSDFMGGLPDHPQQLPPGLLGIGYSLPSARGPSFASTVRESCIKRKQSSMAARVDPSIVSHKPRNRGGSTLFAPPRPAERPHTHPPPSSLAGPSAVSSPRTRLLIGPSSGRPTLGPARPANILQEDVGGVRGRGPASTTSGPSATLFSARRSGENSAKAGGAGASRFADVEGNKGMGAAGLTRWNPCVMDEENEIPPPSSSAHGSDSKRPRTNASGRNPSLQIEHFFSRV